MRMSSVPVKRSEPAMRPPGRRYLVDIGIPPQTHLCQQGIDAHPPPSRLAVDRHPGLFPLAAAQELNAEGLIARPLANGGEQRGFVHALAVHREHDVARLE